MINKLIKKVFSAAVLAPVLLLALASIPAGASPKVTVLAFGLFGAQSVTWRLRDRDDFLNGRYSRGHKAPPDLQQAQDGDGRSKAVATVVWMTITDIGRGALAAE